MGEPSVAAIVVTHNRLALLQECLASLRTQSRPLQRIIVVDNASDDGTPAYLAQQSDLTVIRQPNLGSAGGFHTGIKFAYEHNHDWFWCMDDDTIPDRDALERMTLTPYFSAPQTGFLASLVRWTDGSTHRMNSPLPAQHHEWYRTVLKDKCVRIASCSFVSVMFSRAAVTKMGLPIKEFFIWSDDIEYTERIGGHFVNYLVLDSGALHKTKLHTGGVLPARIEPSEYLKYRHGVRNEVALIGMREGSLLKKIGRWGRLLGRYLSMVLTGRAPVRLLGWFWSGLWFRPKPEMVS